MNGYITNIEQDTLENENYRKVLFTTHKSQLVLMSLNPGEEIGMETHDLDQFIRIEAGNGKAILDGEEHDIGDGSAVVVPAGTSHNIVNTSADKALKLYTIYSPPEHRNGTIHKTKSEADADQSDHFDGMTSL